MHFSPLQVDRCRAGPCSYLGARAARASFVPSISYRNFRSSLGKICADSSPTSVGELPGDKKNGQKPEKTVGKGGQVGNPTGRDCQEDRSSGSQRTHRPPLTSLDQPRQATISTDHTLASFSPDGCVEAGLHRTFGSAVIPVWIWQAAGHSPSERSARATSIRPENLSSLRRIRLAVRPVSTDVSLVGRTVLVRLGDSAR